jgi:hypothetical protein
VRLLDVHVADSVDAGEANTMVEAAMNDATALEALDLAVYTQHLMDRGDFTAEKVDLVVIASFVNSVGGSRHCHMVVHGDFTGEQECISADCVTGCRLEGQIAVGMDLCMLEGHKKGLNAGAHVPLPQLVQTFPSCRVSE